MQSTGYISWKGSGTTCWNKGADPNTMYPDLPATVSSFALKDNLFSGVFEWDSKKFDMTGEVTCYGMRLYDDPNSAGVGTIPNIILGSTFYDFQNKALPYTLTNAYKYLEDNPYYDLVCAQGIIKNATLSYAVRIDFINESS